MDVDLVDSNPKTSDSKKQNFPAGRGGSGCREAAYTRDRDQNVEGRTKVNRKFGVPNDYLPAPNQEPNIPLISNFQPVWEHIEIRSTVVDTRNLKMARLEHTTPRDDARQITAYRFEIRIVRIEIRI